VPALAIGFIAVKSNAADRRVLLRQGGVALAAFAAGYLAVIPTLQYMLRTSTYHVFAEAPRLEDLVWTFAPGRSLYVLGATVLVAGALRKLNVHSLLDDWRIPLCASLALVPLLILYAVSVETSIHIFVFRYRLVAIPGIALCWALFVSRIDSRALRLLFCVAVVATFSYQYFGNPSYRQHGYTWKYALEFAEKSASVGNVPVLICSDLPDADHFPIPTGASLKDNIMFAPLTYYTLSTPAVGLPRSLNDDAKRIVSNFLEEPARRRARFLALGYVPSYPTLQFIVDTASGTHRVRTLGILDGVKVLEFTPREVDGVGAASPQ
jgi:hypothetical protein